MALFTLLILACLTSPLLYSTTATATATATRSTAASSGLVDQACESTIYEAFCHTLLDPLNYTQDPFDLVNIACGLTYYNATSTKDYIDSWLGLKENNRKSSMRQGMLHCNHYYKQAIRALTKLDGDIIKRVSERLFALALYVEEQGWDCEYAFKHGYPDDVMAKKNQNFIELADICIASSRLFPAVVN